MLTQILNRDMNLLVQLYEGLERLKGSILNDVYRQPAKIEGIYYPEFTFSTLWVGDSEKYGIRDILNRKREELIKATSNQSTGDVMRRLLITNFSEEMIETARIIGDDDKINFIIGNEYLIKKDGNKILLKMGEERLECIHPELPQGIVHYFSENCIVEIEDVNIIINLPQRGNETFTVLNGKSALVFVPRPGTCSFMYYNSSGEVKHRIDIIQTLQRIETWTDKQVEETPVFQEIKKEYEYIWHRIFEPLGCAVDRVLEDILTNEPVTVKTEDNVKVVPEIITDHETFRRHVYTLCFSRTGVSGIIEVYWSDPNKNETSVAVKLNYAPETTVRYLCETKDAEVRNRRYLFEHTGNGIRRVASLNNEQERMIVEKEPSSWRVEADFRTGKLIVQPYRNILNPRFENDIANELQAVHNQMILLQRLQKKNNVYKELGI